MFAHYHGTLILYIVPVCVLIKLERYTHISHARILVRVEYVGTVSVFFLIQPAENSGLYFFMCQIVSLQKATAFTRRNLVIILSFESYNIST